MPKASPKAKVKSAKLSKSDIGDEKKQSTKSPILHSINKIRAYRPVKRDYLALIIVGLAVLAFFNKGWFIAATVNGQPLTNLEVQKRLNSSYKESVVNQMVGEKILEQEGTKKGVVISQQDLNSRVEADEKSYGGKEVFEMLLSQQGLSREDYLTRVKALLLIERIYSAEIKPTDEEMKSFMEENASLPEATDEAKFKEFAATQLSQQKLSQVFSQKFSELRKSANIQIF